MDPDTIQALELDRDVGGEGHWALLILVDEQFVQLLRELQRKRKNGNESTKISKMKKELTVQGAALTLRPRSITTLKLADSLLTRRFGSSTVSV